VPTPDWLTDTRTSYDTVAVDYAELLRDSLARSPYDRAVLALFAELVRSARSGAVADVGCGPGRITAHLRDLGLDVFGIDLSPGMVEVARRDHPDLRFEVGSMTDLALDDASLTGLVAWYSLIHVPDDELPRVLGHVRRVVRPGGVVLLAFQVGDESRLKTEGYGGHPMSVHVHLRRPERLAAVLDAAGLPVEAHLLHRPEETPTPQAYLIARRL
jgi:ubiquinone/menaquinone biosynthesis C-methylase UbiE